MIRHLTTVITARVRKITCCHRHHMTRRAWGSSSVWHRWSFAPCDTPSRKYVWPSSKTCDTKNFCFTFRCTSWLWLFFFFLLQRNKLQRRHDVSSVFFHFTATNEKIPFQEIKKLFYFLFKVRKHKRVAEFTESSQKVHRIFYQSLICAQPMGVQACVKCKTFIKNKLTK